jgi:rubrerythrin
MNPDETQRPAAATAPARALVRLLQLAYSAERAAAFAYQGHAGSVSDPDVAASLEQIEAEEWHHRDCVLTIMNDLAVSPSRWFELKYFVIGRFISASCYVIGWFMPMYFAGRLESGNVNEYIELERLLHAHGTQQYDTVLKQMAVVEKEHEVFFLEQITDHWMLPLFRPFFRWGPTHSFNELPAPPIEE